MLQLLAAFVSNIDVACGAEAHFLDLFISRSEILNLEACRILSRISKRHVICYLIRRRLT